MKTFLRILFWVLGLLFSTLPTLIAILEFFPIWAAEGGETMVSGITAVLLCLAAIPILRILRDKLRSPSPFMLWFILWVMLSAMRKVVDGLCTVALISFPACLVGAICFRISRRIAATP